MRSQRETGWGIPLLAFLLGCLGSAHSWAPSVVPTLREGDGSRLPSSTLQASGGNSQPPGLPSETSTFFMVSCTLSWELCRFSSSFAMETGKNSFSHLTLSDRLLDYCLRGVFLSNSNLQNK